MKNKKKTIIISAIGFVLLLAVIVTAVVMKQPGRKAAKEPDKSEQTATDPTSVDDEKAVEDELPVVPIQAEDAVSGGQSGDTVIGNNGKKDSPSTSGTNGSRIVRHHPDQEEKRQTRRLRQPRTRRLRKLRQPNRT